MLGGSALSIKSMQGTFIMLQRVLRPTPSPSNALVVVGMLPATPWVTCTSRSSASLGGLEEAGNREPRPMTAGFSAAKRTRMSK